MYAFDNCCSLTLRFNHWIECCAQPATKTQTINSEMLMLKNTSTIYGNHFASLKTSEFIRLFSRLCVCATKSQAIIYDSCCVLLYVMFYFGRISFVFTACTATSCMLVQSKHGMRKENRRKEGKNGAFRNERANENVCSRVQTNSNAQMKYLKSDIKK